MEKTSKTESKKEIQRFFEEIKNKTPKEVKKIKRLAMKYNLPLKEKRKLFCKYCSTPYVGSEKVRIKDKMKSVECSRCRKVAKWKINSF